MPEQTIKINLGVKKEKIKKVFWSDTKGKIVIVLFAVVAILVLLQLVGGVPVSTAIQEPIYVITGFHQDFLEAGDGNPTIPEFNMVVFPYSTMSCQTDTHPTAIFASVEGKVSIVYEEPDYGENTWKGYAFMGGLPPEYDPLTEIKPYKKYYVEVLEDCVFELLCPERHEI